MSSARQEEQANQAGMSSQPPPPPQPRDHGGAAGAAGGGRADFEMLKSVLDGVNRALCSEPLSSGRGRGAPGVVKPVEWLDGFLDRASGGRLRPDCSLPPCSNSLPVS